MDYRLVWTFVHEEKLSFKKNRASQEQERADIARAIRGGSIPNASSSSLANMSRKQRWRITRPVFCTYRRLGEHFGKLIQEWSWRYLRIRAPHVPLWRRITACRYT